MKWLIYKYTNKLNNKIYIGLTSQTLSKRAGKDGINYKKCPAFYNAIEKYGWDNFIPTILEDNIASLEEANLKEIQYIRHYQSQNPKNGYNITSGGNQISSTKEVAQKIANGVKRAWEDGGKLDLIKRTPIYCIELDLIFHSVQDAADFVYRSTDSIRRACQGKSRYCGFKEGQPLHWIYLKDKTEQKIQELKNRKENFEGAHDIRIYCVELEQYYDNAKDAMEKTGIISNQILKVLKKEGAYAGIYKGIFLHWLYEFEVTEEKIKELKNKKERFNSRIPSPVECLETQEIYVSAKEAAEVLNYNYDKLRRIIDKPKGIIDNKNHTLHFIYRRDLINNTKLM